MAFESLILDARGNPYQGSLDSIGGETLTDARASAQVLGALSAEVLIDVQGKNIVQFDVRTAAGALTYLFEGTMDGTNYLSIPMWTVSQTLVSVALAGQYQAQVVVATTHVATHQINASGWRRIRCRVSAYTSGNITVAARGTEANLFGSQQLVPSILHVTATAAANASATASLPAAGAGLFHYITYIDITRNATAVLAGTATLIHTTTNLPGSPAWSVGNAMNAGGTEKDVVYKPTTPLKSLLSNTATTVVAAAAGAAVLVRVNVSYYVGP